MSQLKFKHIHVTVKTLRVSTDMDIKQHEFQLEGDATKQVVNHTLYKKEEGAENMTLSYKKTMGEDIQKIVI